MSCNFTELSEKKINDINSNDINHLELDTIRKIIENMKQIHHIEIAKIFKKNNIKLTENNNGIFINLNNIPKYIIDEIYEYINFIKTQENHINIDETKKVTLENIYFKDNGDKETNTDIDTNKNKNKNKNKDKDNKDTLVNINEQVINV